VDQDLLVRDPPISSDWRACPRWRRQPSRAHSVTNSLSRLRECCRARRSHENRSGRYQRHACSRAGGRTGGSGWPAGL